jgi:ribosomal protein S12
MSVRAFAITGLVTALDCKAYLSKKQHLIVAFGKLFTRGTRRIITTNGGDIMGIHYDYKSTRGAKKMQKQQERDERRRNKKTRPMPTQKQDEGRPLTLDMITDPNK